MQCIYKWLIYLPKTSQANLISTLKLPDVPLVPRVILSPTQSPKSEFWDSWPLRPPSSFGPNDRFYVSSCANANYQAFVLHVMHDWIETLAFRIKALKIYSEVDQLIRCTSVPHNENFIVSKQHQRRIYFFCGPLGS